MHNAHAEGLAMDQNQLEQYQRDGFVVVSGLFYPEETALYRDYYMDMRHKQNEAGMDIIGDPSDPLRQYSRLMHPHRHDQLSLDWLLDKRLAAWLTVLCGKAPYAVQTMVYFKPAGARGQALHQDQFYLRVQPGTCIAAWMALDDCDDENGCLQVVPGTHTLPVLCSVPADTTQSFTDDTVDLPEGMSPIPVIMQAGDVLFFNGQVVHGSYPNTSKDRFRRALIGHYIDGDAQQVAMWYKPVLRLDGTEVEIGVSEWGGRCGVWVDKDGNPEVELSGTETRQNYSAH
jgi:ectoine hydroxylase-related dioxygenase (phytanoyl-CoA dioxygenase family)